MAPLRGWAPKGERLPGRVPYRHWNTMAILAALRHDRIDAPFLLDGPVNREGFLAYVKEAFAPTLSPGDVVVADNLACHKHPDVRRALRVVGARLILLPRYSPDLNPIEQVFAKLKHLLRKVTCLPRGRPPAMRVRLAHGGVGWRGLESEARRRRSSASFGRLKS